MPWLRTHAVGTLTIASVIMSAAIGIVSNMLVGSWGWALLTALLVLVAALAIIEFVRHRIDRPTRPPTSTAPQSDDAARGISITDSKISGVVAGRDVNQLRVGTGGLAVIAAAALLLGGGATYLGQTDAAIPDHARTDQPAASTPPATSPSDTPPPTPTQEPGNPSFQSSAVVTTNGKDLDPPDSSDGTADVSFNSRRSGEGGFALLNGAALAQIPGQGRPTATICEAADGYSSDLVAMPIAQGLSRCLRTSDGRYGTLSVTGTQSNALGGLANITWTVW